MHFRSTYKQRISVSLHGNLNCERTVLKRSVVTVHRRSVVTCKCQKSSKYKKYFLLNVLCMMDDREYDYDFAEHCSAVMAVVYIQHYISHVFLFIDWLKACHVIKNKLTILQKLLISHK